MDGDRSVLFVLTSQKHLGSTGKLTGFNFEELAAAYYILREADVRVELSSIRGGLPPIEPTSFDRLNREKNTPSVYRFVTDMEAMYKLGNTLSIDSFDIEGFDAVYLPGGHGCMWDFPDNGHLQKTLRQAFQQEKTIAAVGHGPAALVNVTFHGKYIVHTHKINSITNEEERATGRADLIPFLLESRLRARGANFKGTRPGKGFCIESGPFITGQNSLSAAIVARKLAARIGVRGKQAAA